MPSVKSYQNRKREIESLRHLLQQYEAYLKSKDLIIAQLEAHINYVGGLLVDQAKINPTVILNNVEETELLKKEIEALKVTLRLYREYILKNYSGDFVNLVDIARTRVEIPKCLKPFDAIKYIGELNGLDYKS
jgi:hypothetical protein